MLIWPARRPHRARRPETQDAHEARTRRGEPVGGQDPPARPTRIAPSRPNRQRPSRSPRAVASLQATADPAPRSASSRSARRSGSRPGATRSRPTCSTPTATSSPPAGSSLLYDPDGADAWDGELRLVAFASAELEADIANDPSLPEVGWSWLTGALAERQADHLAAGGTVTQTTLDPIRRPARAQDDRLDRAARLVDGPRPPISGRTCSGFLDLLCTAAGLPPEGVSVLPTT